MSVERLVLKCDLMFKNKVLKRRNHKYKKKEQAKQKGDKYRV